MSRLIDADDLIKDILDLRDCYNGFSDTYAKACIIGVIDEQPTIEERKKGTPCDLCRHNPPSSGDGKPCSYCPAEQI